MFPMFTSVCKMIERNCRSRQRPFLILMSHPLQILLAAMDIVSSEVFSLPRHSGAFRWLSIADDDYRKKLISDLIWDIAVVNRLVPTNQCDFFSSLFPADSFPDGFKYLLRDVDQPGSSFNEFSLNYCCDEAVTYSPACFKIGHPSPGNKQNSI